jgi:hypothetical protein
VVSFTDDGSGRENDPAKVRLEASEIALSVGRPLLEFCGVLS